MEILVNISSVLETAGFSQFSSIDTTNTVELSDWLYHFTKNNHIKRMKVLTFLKVLKAIFT